MSGTIGLILIAFGALLVIGGILMAYVQQAE